MIVFDKMPLQNTFKFVDNSEVAPHLPNSSADELGKNPSLLVV